MMKYGLGEPKVARDPSVTAATRGTPRWDMVSAAVIGAVNEQPVRVDIALLNAARGVALVDLVPHRTPLAVATLRNTLKATGCKGIAARSLPIVYLRLTPSDLAQLPARLDTALPARDAPGLAAAGWTAEVRRILTDGPAAVAPPMPVTAMLAAGGCAALLVAGLAWLAIGPASAPDGSDLAGAHGGLLAVAASSFRTPEVPRVASAFGPVVPVFAPPVVTQPAGADRPVPASVASAPVVPAPGVSVVPALVVPVLVATTGADAVAAPSLSGGVSPTLPKAARAESLPREPALPAVTGPPPPVPLELGAPPVTDPVGPRVTPDPAPEQSVALALMVPPLPEPRRWTEPHALPVLRTVPDLRAVPELRTVPALLTVPSLRTVPEQRTVPGPHAPEPAPAQPDPVVAPIHPGPAAPGGGAIAQPPASADPIRPAVGAGSATPPSPPRVASARTRSADRRSLNADRAIEPTPTSIPASPRCGSLLARLQLGETPTHEERLLLRTACAPRS